MLSYENNATEQVLVTRCDLVYRNKAKKKAVLHLKSFLRNLCARTSDISFPAEGAKCFGSIAYLHIKTLTLNLSTHEMYQIYFQLKI